MRAQTRIWTITCCFLVLLGASIAAAQAASPLEGKLDSLEARIKMLEAIKSPVETPAPPVQPAPPPMSVEDSIANAKMAELQRRIDKLAAKLSPATGGSKPAAPPASQTSTPIAVVPPEPKSEVQVHGASALSVVSPAVVIPVEQPATPTTLKMVSSVEPVAPVAQRPVSELTTAPASSPTMAVVIPEQPKTPPAPSATVAPKIEKSPGISLKPGRGFTIESPDNSFSLQPGGRLQFRHSFSKYDRGRKTPNLSNFSVERFEIWLSGKAFTDWSYKFEANFGKGNVRLGDGFVEWSRYDAIRPKMGQFKVQFDRQMKTSSSEQEFVDRSATAKAFGIERDIGLLVSGATSDKTFQYNAGLFNGEGENKANTGAGELAILRISANPNGDFGFAESDVKNTAKYLWVLDAAVAYNASSAYKDWSGDGTIGGHDDEANVLRFVGGLGYRHAGWFAQGEYYNQTESPKMSGLKKVRGNGWYAQLGYMIVPASWELAARYGFIDPDLAKSENSKREVTIGVNHFLLGTGHAMKMAADVTLKNEQKTGGVRLNDVEVRTQLQLTY